MCWDRKAPCCASYNAQIEAGGPLEVTPPEMERFFMSSDRAVGLILSVAATGAGQGSYFMEMGDPISILDLGRDLIARSGKAIGIEFTGLRPGEKLRAAHRRIRAGGASSASQRLPCEPD
ncbi:MAG: polysaccharide biosynthesis protein [Hyphomonadaceae bacterium]